MYESLVKVYELLKDQSFHTSQEIAQQLGVSDKTARKVVHQLTPFLNDHSITLQAVVGKGYQLQGDVKSAKDLFPALHHKTNQGKESRLMGLLKVLMESNHYQTLTTLAETFSVSEKTLSNDLKQLKNKLKPYEINLLSKPYYGIKLAYTEENLRALMIDLINRSLNKNLSGIFTFNFDLFDKSRAIHEFLMAQNVRMSDQHFQYFLTVIFVCLQRQGKLNLTDKPKDLLFKERLIVVKSLFMEIFPMVSLTENDFDYISMHLLSAQTFAFDELNDNEEVNQLVRNVISFLKINFHLDLDENLKFRQQLHNHLFSLLIRLRLGIRLHNPILEEIQSQIRFEYHIAQRVAEMISQSQHKTINVDEIAYLAVIIKMGIDTSKEKRHKNFLVVCPSGRSVSQFFIHAYEQHFSQHQSSLQALGVNELQDFPLDDVDGIFTFAPLPFSLNKPTYQVDYFLSPENIRMIHHLLASDKKANEPLSGDLFLKIHHKTTKAEIISLMSEKIEQKFNLTEDINSLILERETLPMTELGSFVAIAHPIHQVKNINALGVCLLDEPVLWQNHKVRLVFFLFLDSFIDNKVIYKTILNIAEDEQKISRLLQADTFDNFYQTFYSFNTEETL